MNILPTVPRFGAVCLAMLCLAGPALAQVGRLGDREYDLLKEPPRVLPAPAETAPKPMAFKNCDGVFILKGTAGMAAYNLEGEFKVVDLKFEQANEIRGIDAYDRPQVHQGWVYTVVGTKDRFFFSTTPLGIHACRIVYPLYLSQDGKPFRRFVSLYGTRLVERNPLEPKPPFTLVPPEFKPRLPLN